MRDKLIEKIKMSVPPSVGDYAEVIADELLDDGWERCSCGLGQTVYSYCEEFCRVFEYRVENIHISENATQYEAFSYIGMELADVIDFEDEDIGKTVFLTREEALKALRGGGE